VYVLDVQEVDYLHCLMCVRFFFGGGGLEGLFSCIAIKVPPYQLMLSVLPATAGEIKQHVRTIR
jgi:hypothetical protein